MDSLESLGAVIEALDRDSFSGCVDVLVQNSNQQYLYSNINVRVSPNYSYRNQIDVDIYWENDANQRHYSTLGLHGRYNSNFQQFSCSNGTLTWQDGKNTISVFFNKN